MPVLLRTTRGPTAAAVGVHLAALLLLLLLPLLLLLARDVAPAAAAAAAEAGDVAAAAPADAVTFECDPGFYYDADADVCTRSQCVCAHGVPASPEACSGHGDEMCFSCNQGYFLTDDDKCTPEADDGAGGTAGQTKNAAAAAAAKQKVCRNGDVRRSEKTLVDWLASDEFLECTDLLLNVRVGNSGDAGAKAIAAALIRAGKKSKLEHLILTAGAISNEGAEWLAAALGAELPEYDDDENDPAVTEDEVVEDAAAELLKVDITDEYEKERRAQVAKALSETIGVVRLPRRRVKGAGRAPITDVNLYKNRIGDVGAEAFADALRANKKIRSLHLSHNQIGVTGFRALLDVVKAKGTRHLEQLWLDGNSYDENSRKLRPLVDSMRRQLSKNEQRGMRRRGIKWQQHEL